MAPLTVSECSTMVDNTNSTIRCNVGPNYKQKLLHIITMLRVENMYVEVDMYVTL